MPVLDPVQGDFYPDTFANLHACEGYRLCAARPEQSVHLCDNMAASGNLLTAMPSVLHEWPTVLSKKVVIDVPLILIVDWLRPRW